MSSVLNHRVACELARYLLRQPPIATDIGAVTLHADADHEGHVIAHVRTPAGVQSFVVRIVVGDLAI